MVTLKTIYICDICGEEYDTPEKAEACERVSTQCPVHDIGSMVRVLTREGMGELVEVKDFVYIRPSDGGERFAHKILYSVMYMDGDVSVLNETQIEAV